MSSSPFKLPSWDDVKAERRRQGRQNRIEGESSIDLSESRGATEVGGGGFNYSGNSAPSDFERLRDADLFLDTHSQASLQAQFPHPSPTRGAPYVGRYDRYLRSSQNQSEDEDEQESLGREHRGGDCGGLRQDQHPTSPPSDCCTTPAAEQRWRH